MKLKFSIVIVGMLILASCKTTRNVAKPSSQPQIRAVETLIEQVQKVQPTFKTANVSKMAMEIKMNEKNFNVSSTCKIQKDSAIYLSIQPFLGIELFKAELTPDSMKVIDKMNRRYYVVDYSYFTKRFGVGVDFYSLQSLIFNQFFCIGQKEVTTDGLTLTSLTDGRSKIEFESPTMKQTTEISGSQLIENVLLIAKNTGYQLQTTYQDYTVVNAVNFPQKISMVATNQKSSAYCNFSILRVEFNNKLTFAKTNTDRYTRGDIDQLIKK